MSKTVIDASALLALISDEEGADVVERLLPEAVISTVNVSEVATVLQRQGLDVDDVQSIINTLVSNQKPFTSEQAYQVAQLKIKTKRYGLSLGDCACLGLALIEKLPVLTSDKQWQKIDLPISIELIR